MGGHGRHAAGADFPGRGRTAPVRHHSGLHHPMSEEAQKADKEKKQLLVVAVLIAVFAFLIVKNIVLRPKGPRPAPAAQAQADVSRQVADQLVYTTTLRTYDNQRQEQLKVWEKEWGRDPFVPLASLSTI